MIKSDTFGHRFRLALEKTGMSQQMFCDRYDLPRSTVSQYLTGKRNPRRENLYELAKCLGVTEAWLLGYDEEEDVGLDEMCKIFGLLNDQNKERALSYVKALLDVQTA